MKTNKLQPIWTLALVLALVSPLGLTPAAASVPSGAHAAAPAQPDIVVDGLIDAAYGPPVASDPAGDHWAGNTNIDLLDLYVAEDTSYLYVAMTINADINTTNWGKYALYVDTTNDANGAPSDAWTRNVVVNDPHKPEYGLYSWVDCPTYGPSCTQFWAWDGSWSGVGTLDGAAKATTGITSTLEWQIQKSRLGDPEEIWVEAWTTGGGTTDNAQDTINDPADDWNASDWSTTAVLANSTYFDVQVGPPPEPGPDNSVWWGGLEHDSRSDFYRQPFGALPSGTPYTLRFRTYANDVTGVKIRLWDTHQNGQTLYSMTPVTTVPGDPYDYDVWELNLTTPDYLTVLYYRFIVTDGSDTDYYEDDDLYDGGLGQAYDTSPDYSWQIDVYDPAFTTPDWFKEGVVYQIFPDRFRNGVDANDPISGTFFYDEDPGVVTAPQWNWIVPDPRVTGTPWEGSYSKLFYGGDLQGIIDKLDYLQNLGVTVLYFNPIFESPSNHKYDTTDYEMVDDNFGDLATFQALVTELDSRGMHLVLDGVFNHTSSDSKYFDRYGRYPEVGACEDVNSPYRDWYYFYPASPPGSGVCAGDTTYEAWWGFDSLPKLNTTDNPGVRTYIYSDTNPSPPPPIATYWLEEGAGGWRLDVAGDVADSFWRDWRPYIRNANPEAITIAEEWGDASRFILGDMLDSSMNYRFRNAVIGLLRETDWQDTNSFIRNLNVSQFDSLMHSVQEDYPPQAYYAMMNLVGSHDVNRVLVPLDLADTNSDPTATDWSLGKARLQMLALIQMTLPGAPTIYYGDEVGLVGYGDENGGGVFYSDPYNRQPYPWPDEPGYGDLPAWRQQDMSLYGLYSALAAARNGNPALRLGSFDTLLTDDTNNAYAYGRKLGDDAAVVAVNLGPTQTLTLDVAGYLPDGTNLTDHLSWGAYTVVGGQIVLTSVPSMWGALLTVDAGQDLTPPDAPANLAAAEGDGEVYLTWGSTTGAAGYHVYRSYVSGGGYTRIATGTLTTAFTDTTVSNGQWFYYVVTGLDALGNESGRSDEAAALPHAAIGWAGELAPPSIVHTIGLTPTPPISAQVWIDGVTSGPGQGAGVVAELGVGFTGTLTNTWDWAPMAYAADVGNNDQYTATLTPEMTGTLQYLARFSTTAGREWTYATTAGGQPGVLTVQPSSDTTPPATPQNLAVADWSAEWVSLEWDPVAGDPTLYAYDVYRSELARNSWTQVGRVLAPDTTFTDDDVTTGYTYFYVVQAVDSSFNKSDFSNQVQATAEAKLVAVTFQAVVPDYTPADATVYVVGDAPELCGWCSPQTVAMDHTGSVTWTKTLTLTDGQSLQYKYSRGNWDKVEWWGPVVSVFNRSATVSYGADGSQLLADTVHYWRDPLVIDHDPLEGATDVPTDAVVRVTLSRFLDPATITADNLALSGASVDIGFFHHTEMTATTILMTPTVALDADTPYTVTLETGLAGLGWDNEGIALQRQYNWTFRTAAPAMRYIYLPIVLRAWPPRPYQPILDPIQDAEDGDYDVSWQELPTPQADTYTLQEAQDAGFTVGLREVCTTAQQSCALSGQPAGTYYYRVRGQNAYGASPWSEAQMAVVPDLKGRVTDFTLTLPQPLGGLVSSWCTWSWCSISPRLYHAPLPDGRTLVGWTDASGSGHVSVVSASGSLDQTYDYAAKSLRGLVAHDDGGFAVLLWDAGAKIMWLSKLNAAGGQIWTTNVDGSMTSFNPNIGDSRLAYGNGAYAAYFAVHGDSGWPAGHEGDQLTYVDDNGAIQAGGWEWGCSHSMAELVSYHSTFDKFAPTCSSDCYASKGILLNDSQVVYASDGNCGGLVSTQLGQIALSGDAWKLVFSALDRPGFVGQGIGLATVDGSFQSSYVWLTHTSGQYERDPVLARLGSGLQSDRYLVGWQTTNDGRYWLGVIDGAGNFVEGPEDVSTAGIAWGNRDDSFRTRADGSVSWVKGDPSSATLHLFRFDGAGYGQ